jgi:hypothetical protein
MDPQVYNTIKKVQAADRRRNRIADLKARSNARSRSTSPHPRNASDLEELAFDLLNITWSDTMDENIVNQIIEVKTVGLGDPDYVNENLRGHACLLAGQGRPDPLGHHPLRARDHAEGGAGRRHRPAPGRARARLLGHVRQARHPGAREALAASGHPAHRAHPGRRRRFAVLRHVRGGHADRHADRPDHRGGRRALEGQRHDPRLTPGGAQARDGRTRLRPERPGAGVPTGEIGNYKGYSVVQVENFEDFNGNLVLPTDELWLVGQNSGRLTYYGATAKVQQLRLPSFYLRWETARDAGMLLYGAAKGRIGRIVLT